VDVVASVVMVLPVRVIVHVAAVVSFVEAYYVEAFGDAHSLSIAQHFWERAPYFYSVVGVYGSAIALWWLFRPSSEPSAKQHGTRRTSRAAQRLRLKAFSLSREESRSAVSYGLPGDRYI